ncbi:uncharacterized protein F5Z01DRAFT_682966 [Emericellopsis atlantica]|uniref:Clr5 domain-containing protein n=1 Tax=Emericellopsis atlantica TaxID=2614577 RepID=A0A9P7ZGU7_9HYPO|nr:uncharacterized protein F5Z01DRAFT_682966 [Emericellopsis atlantica]KAG9251903.1 hypothetical protein F5Z01DRAFT_682966 [Emericellopsis atlantica]
MADWAHLRPVVRELYIDRRWTMAQISHHLVSLGYRVNTRMVRTRITMWNLQRNNRTRDMVAALCLLDPDPAMWPWPEPCFLIRGRRVPMSEVLCFFRRKGIRKPVQWARATAHTLARGGHHHHETAVTLLQGNGGSGTGHPGPTHMTCLEQRAVASLRDYCMAYIGLGRAGLVHEPEVHQFTTHGRFGDRMQEGLAQMVHVRGGSAGGAFVHFGRAFDLVRPLLQDCHPMSLAQLLAVACELAACTARGGPPVLASLLGYTAAMASILRLPESLTMFLGTLSLCCSTPHTLLVAAVSSLRAALAVFSERSPTTWHRLYIQERLCDCLYHGRDRTEGPVRRAQLLRDQESFYVPCARNVLWTMTNVADDQLWTGSADGGRLHYSTTLARAERLGGFGRAKIRFAALEGLARVEQRRFEELSGRGGGDDAHAVGECLHTMRRFLDEALGEALIWFEPTSRRTTRVKEKARQVRHLLAAMGSGSA